MYLRNIYKLLKSQLRIDPTIDKQHQLQYIDYIPNHKKCVVTFCADFELAWAWLHTKRFENPLERALEKARLARKNFELIINLCESHQIPITWATVGHLFLDSCKQDNHIKHNHISRIPYFETWNWKYDQGDWFDFDPSTDLTTSPEFYAPDLINRILNSNAAHEIGSHSFSHLSCQNDLCPENVFLDEISECLGLAKEIDIQLKTFVHPGNQIGHLKSLKKAGFTSYRTNHRNVLGYPIYEGDKFWQFEQTMEIVYVKDWTLKQNIDRYLRIIRSAIKSNTVCYFWFHPSSPTVIFDEIMPAIFKFILEHKEDIHYSTNGEYIDYLNNQIK